MSVESIERNKELGRFFFAEQDRLKGGPAPELCAPTYTAQLVGFPTFDRDAHEQFATAFYRAFPDLYHTIDETVAESDRVAVRFTLRGTHGGDFMGIPATQKPVVIACSAVLDVEDGKVTELRAIFDQMGLMRQLGVIPS